MSDGDHQPIPPAPPPASLVERPWGSFKQFAHNRACTVSLMTVLPGQRLSLQAHAGRAELWIVIDDGALVQVGEVERSCRAGEEIWIAAGVRHRLSNRTAAPLRVLEVAFGDWQQGDIQRYADDYRRDGGLERRQP